MKKVLIISYYWPPSGGAGVQRWLKMTKYLPENGWKPIIYTPENPEVPARDESLFKDIHPDVEVIKRPITEPYSFYRSFLGVKGEVNAGFLSEKAKPKKKEGLSVWLRGNLFIPDARSLWIKPSVRYLKKYLRSHPVDAIISTGPPHSMHLIARPLAHSFGIPWLADFRDHWTEIDFYHQLKLSCWADRRHHSQEKKIALDASRLITVTPTIAESFHKTYGIEPLLVYNGFDHDDFKTEAKVEKAMFSLVHAGAMNPDRNHPAFWQALARIKNEDGALFSRVQIKLIGKVDVGARSLISELGLDAHVEHIPYVEHDELVRKLKSASALYLPINRTPAAPSIITGKIFEYLAAARPILGTGPVNGDAATVLKECQAGNMLDFDDVEGISSLLKEWIQKAGKGELKLSSRNTDMFSRKKQAGLIAEELERLTEQRN